MLIEASPDGSQFIVAESTGEGVILHTIRNDEELLREIAQVRSTFNRTGSHGDGLKLATVPNALVAQWDREERDEKDRLRWLNDADNAKWRTTDGWRA